jgi:hypothetical protein
VARSVSPRDPSPATRSPLCFALDIVEEADIETLGCGDGHAGGAARVGAKSGESFLVGHQPDNDRRDLTDQIASVEKLTR